MCKSILVISPWTGRIGPNTFLEGFVKENISQGNLLTILYPFKDEISDNFKKSGCRVIFIKILTLRSINNIYFKILYRFTIESLLSFVFPYFLLKKRYDSCMVNTELFSFSLIIPSILVRIIMIVHSLSFNGNLLTRIIFGVQQKAVHKYVAVSDAVKSALKGMGIRREIRRVYNGLDLDEEKKAHETAVLPEKIQLIAVIHSLPHKGAHYLLDVLHKVTKAEKDIHCSIIGWGSILHDSRYKSCVEKSANELGLLNFLTFKGVTKDIRSEYKAADIMIHPSESESFGYVLVEAMEYELPIVAFRVGGIPEVVEDQGSGILIDPFDTDSMASALLVLIKDESLRLQFGIRGRQIVEEKFDLKKNMAEIVGML